MPSMYRIDVDEELAAEIASLRVAYAGRPQTEFWRDLVEDGTTILRTRIDAASSSSGAEQIRSRSESAGLVVEKRLDRELASEWEEAMLPVVVLSAACLNDGSDDVVGLRLLLERDCAKAAAWVACVTEKREKGRSMQEFRVNINAEVDRRTAELFLQSLVSTRLADEFRRLSDGSHQLLQPSIKPLSVSDTDSELDGDIPF